VSAAVHPDLFITIVFVSLVVASALFGLAVARSERRRDDAAAEEDAQLRNGSEAHRALDLLPGA
jgi:hypothetical protein